MKNLPVFLAEELQAQGLTSKEQHVQRSERSKTRLLLRGQRTVREHWASEYPTQLAAGAEGLPDEGEELRPGPEDPGVRFLWNLEVKDLF